MTEANLLTEWARLLMASFADAGVTNVVLSPGSRSTPFMVAAEQEPRLRCHDSMDERAASFFAIGQARVTGRPSLVICTSGTAGAHYLPAVVEANLSNVPLLLLTADRPLELQECGAPQTIDQIKLMGDHVRRFFELGTADADPGALKGLRRIVAQAVHLSTAHPSGPVHLNGRARKPLEPSGGSTPAEVALRDAVEGLLSRPIVRACAPVLRASPTAVADVAERCRTTRRGLIVSGPAAVSQAEARSAVFELARRTGYPLLCEAGSQFRFVPRPPGVTVVDAFDAVLRSPGFRSRQRPDLVIQLGGTPVSGGWEQCLGAHDDVERVVIAPSGWQDADNGATMMLFGEIGPTVEDLLGALGAGPSSATLPGPNGWTQTFAVANERAWAAVDRDLAAAGPGLTEGSVVRTVVDGLPERSLLMLGNSLPIREVDTFCPAMERDVLVLSQRGANGIDGLVAGTAGAASVQDRPVTLLVGDVSFLHDLTGLGLASAAEVPLVIVVTQNRGGRLFEQLPLARIPGIAASIMGHVTTPHDYDLQHAGRLYGHRHTTVDTPDALAKALQEAYGRPGCTVIEATVPPHGAAEQHRRLFAEVNAQVGGLDVAVEGTR